VEMVICTFLLMMIILGIVEFGRMMLVYTALSNAARAGTRYAIVHGIDRSTGTGVDGQSSSSDTSQITTVVQNFASAGLLDPTQLTITVAYPDTTNAPGNRVTVKVTYPFIPLLSYFPLRTTLGNTSQGVITF
jgi:Flp pilus assembly protein TadG